MSEEVLGAIWVMRYSFPRWVLEVLAITPEKVVAVRPKGGKGAAFGLAIGGLVGATVALAADRRDKKKKQPTLEEILEAGKQSFAMPNSEVKKVELKKALAGLKLNIIGKKKFKCYVKGVDLSKRPSSLSTGIVVDKSEEEDFMAKLQDFESVLQKSYGDRLSVKK